MKRYNIINNSLGWLCFLVAAVTYLLTLEPTASFWDCPEFISQGYKLEVGHPPGNPIFILTARFFINFIGADPSKVAIAVNAMSALLSAGTILLLFWTVTHLMRRLVVRSREKLPSKAQTILIMGAGLVGALAYTWSDTFWFSAVEGEVYAFSSFCTALVVWLILKWENRADQPHSDRYLILVAYVIGISIAVHLLNLLTIPALALVVYFRKAEGDISLKRTLLVLLLSFVIVAAILYGLVPGFVELAQYFELFFVNVVGMSYNMGVLIYAIILVSSLIWCIYSLYRQKSDLQIKISFALSVILSGILFIGSSLLIPILLVIAMIVWLFVAPRIHVRLLTLIATSILVIFIGYSSYAVLLIRSSANPPMNQNSPDNVFALGSYLNREQYGETPLFYGPQFTATPEAIVHEDNTLTYITTPGKTEYAKVVKNSAADPDRYVALNPKQEYHMTPKRLFPRMYSNQPGHADGYLSWIGESDVSAFPKVEVKPYKNPDGSTLKYENSSVEFTQQVPTPSFSQNLSYFFNYQLNYMYWRYFMWNFAGRQNDLQGQGEVNRGNWISGIPFIDNARLGDQSLLPSEFGEGNKGHNVFYMLPLLLGLLGIAAQLWCGSEGIKQFWIVFLLFFMTGIAIVFYLNQPPMQPRERDYAFAGSFYAFSIWIGLGVYMIWKLVCMAIKAKDRKNSILAAAVASAIGLIIPFQMVSQTWDDHDRSGRYCARDFGMNYLSSLDDNAIIFTNGDNDTFPLWYAQEVEGYRKDVRVVNLAYLTTDWYANHAKMPAYEAAAIEFMAEPQDYAYDRLQYNAVDRTDADSMPVDVFSSLEDLYKSSQAYDPQLKLRRMRFPLMYIPVSINDAVNAGVILPSQADEATDFIPVDLSGKRGVTLSEALSLDMIAHGTVDGWKRPAYFAMTVPEEYYLNLGDYLQNTGLAYQVTNLPNPAQVATDKMYDNIMNKFRWGGLDQVDEDGTIYLDETVRRMVTTHRSAMLDLASELYNEGIRALYFDGDEELDEPIEENSEYANDRFHKAVDILRLMEEKLPVKHSPYAIQIGERAGSMYCILGENLDDQELIDHGLDIILGEIMRYMEYIPYYNNLLQAEKKRLIRDGKPSQAKKLTFANLNLSRIDMYVPYYLRLLIQSYVKSGGDIDRLEDALKSVGNGAYESLSRMFDSED